MTKILSNTKFHSNKFRNLTIIMLIWFLLYPFLEGDEFRLIILNIITSVIVLLGVYAVSYDKKTLNIGVIVGIFWFLLSWIDIFSSSKFMILSFIANILLIIFLTYTTVIILHYVLKSSHISGDLLFGAVSIYFLIGGLFGILHSCYVHKGHTGILLSFTFR